MIAGERRWCDPPDDPTTTLVEAGWFMLQQLKIALGYTIGTADADRLVPDLLDRASSFPGVSPGPVGAAALLVDSVRSDDPVEVAFAIQSACDEFGDVAVLAGAAALMASLSIRIAASVALPASVVHAELVDRVRVTMSVCPSAVGRARRASIHRDRCRLAGERPWVSSPIAATRRT